MHPATGDEQGQRHDEGRLSAPLAPRPARPCPLHPLLERELQALYDLLEIAHDTVSSRHLDPVLATILHHAKRLLHVPAGSIALYDARRQVMVLEVHEGLSARFAARRRWRVKPGGLTHRILVENELLVVEDARHSPFFTNPLIREEGIRSLIALPLRSRRRLVGILYLDDFVPRTFPEELVRLLPIFASFAAVCIDNARLYEEAERLACLDGLTELYNRRQLEAALAEEVERSRRRGASFAILMLDLDDFKRVNDRYGHPTGDRVLRELAEALRRVTRECDVLCRYGGDEFVAILPDLGRESARALAERIRSQVRDHLARELAADGIEPPTVSAGVVLFPAHGDDAVTLLRRVDELLLLAKRAGKDRIAEPSL